MPRELPLVEEIAYAEKLTDPQAVYPLETLTEEASEEIKKENKT